MRLNTLLVRVSIVPVIVFSGCDRGSSKDRVQSVVSPDGRIEAVVYEINGGATTSFGYEVDLQKVGDSKATNVAKLYGALQNEGAYGVSLKWPQADSLHIQYLRAKSIASSRPSATIDGQQVIVSLDAGINDPSAPGGRMLHKSQKK
jgi:hypothetical protein